jgi:two-component system NtrC family response regulator
MSSPAIVSAPGDAPREIVAMTGFVAGGWRSYLLADGANRVGSLPDNGVILPVTGVSRHHAVVQVGDGRVRLSDLSSKNGTFIEERRVTDREVALGQRIRFGPVLLRLHALDASQVPPATLQAGAPTQRRETPASRGRETATASEPPVTVGPALSFPASLARCPSPSMTRLYRQLAIVAGSDLPTLLLGETGVGKEGIARLLHASSARGGGPFVSVNCAAVPTDLLEAELFGIGPKVATGVAQRSGRFQQARGGTLLLDEIGDMPPALQAKLLRALQDHEVQPIGCLPEAIDVQIIAATNCDLAARLESGSFRTDLYYRLAGYVLTVPPLRERRADVLALADHWLGELAAASGRPVPALSDSTRELLSTRPWPGNVRQLKLMVHRLFDLCPAGRAISSALLAEADRLGGDALLPAANLGGTPPAAVATARFADTLDLATLEAGAIREALRRSDGNQTRAAELLGISRSALHRRLRK